MGRHRKWDTDDDTKPVASTVPTVHEVDDEDELMDDPTPRKKGKGKAKLSTQVQVIVDSPPRLHPKQRIRTNEAGDAIDAAVVKARDWVASGDVRLT